MMGTLLHHETLIVLTATAGEVDDDGEVIEAFMERDWPGCNVQLKSSVEVREIGEVITTRLLASGPLAEWISDADRVVRDGRQYRVDGEPGHFKGGALDHTELFLIAWKGQ